MANWWTKAMFIIFLRNQQIKDRIKFKSFISNFTNITSKVNARFTEILRYQFMYCISNSKNKCFRVTISYDNSNKVIKSFLRWKHFLFLIFWFNYSHTQLATYINCFVPKILSQQFRSISCNSITISKYIYSLKTICHIFLSEEE